MIRQLIRWALLFLFLLPVFPGQVCADDEGSVEVSITPNPLKVSVFAPSRVFRLSHFIVEARVENLGDDRITGAVATIHFDGRGLRLDDRGAERNIGTIQPHRVRTARWSVEAISAGDYVVLVTVSGKGTIGELTSQDSVAIEVRERPRYFFGFFLRWWRNWFGY